MMRPRTRQALAILATAAVLCAAWTWAARRPGMTAEFAEYNQAANRIRIEGYLARPSAPAHVLVGSSLSGRLLPSYFEGTPMADVATLGLDGSGPRVGIEVLRRRKDWPETVWVETYLMGRETTPNDRALMGDLDATGTRLAVAMPLFRASHRPSSVAYTALKRRREGGGGDATWTTNAAASMRGPSAAPAPVDPGVEEAWHGLLEDLRRRNVRVVFVDVPAGETQRPGVRAQPDLAARLAVRFGIVRMDVREAWFSRGWMPRYTDGRHLDAASARQTARWLAEMAGEAR